MDTLLRSRTNRRIAGICGGLAQHFGWNVTLIRFLWIALVLFGGTGVLLYGILWVVLPEEPLPRTGYAPVYPSTQPYYPAPSYSAPNYSASNSPAQPYSAPPSPPTEEPTTQG